MSTEPPTRIAIEVGQRRPYDLEVTRQDLEIRGLPKSLYGAVFAHISDIHGGFAGLEPVYEEAVRQVSAAEPDYVFFTGDFIDRRTDDPHYPIVDLLRSFRARRDVFGCLGNHDHKRGKVLTRKLLERAGVQLLVNESVRLEDGLCIAGIDDMHEGEPDLLRTFSGLPPDRTSIVLSHNPRLIEQMTGQDVVILSGHTHGAQFRFRFPPPAVICYVHLRVKQVAGWYLRGASRLYVNRGLGVTGKPFRYNCPAEIGLFRMVPHPADIQRDHDSGLRQDERATAGAAH
ncbi:MAG TPA: metallophosphoesterase [Chthonomonadaceae bacterium]|nr:metallophosphoesterase [Chthonomonadaceae bacterium]